MWQRYKYGSPPATTQASAWIWRMALQLAARPTCRPGHVPVTITTRFGPSEPRRKQLLKTWTNSFTRPLFRYPLIFFTSLLLIHSLFSLVVPSCHHDRDNVTGIQICVRLQFCLSALEYSMEKH